MRPAGAGAIKWGTMMGVCTLTGRGPVPERVLLGPAGHAWVLDIVQERFHNTSPGGYEGTSIKAGDSDTRKGLALKKQQESPGWAALAHREVEGKEALGTDSGD